MTIEDLMGYALAYQHLIRVTYPHHLVILLPVLLGLTLGQFVVVRLLRGRAISQQAPTDRSMVHWTAFLPIVILWFLVQVGVPPVIDFRPQALLKNSEQGGSFKQYDDHTQHRLQTGTLPTDFVGFMRETHAGQDILRHPVSGYLYYLAWVTTKATFWVKVIFSVMGLVAILLFYILLKDLTGNALFSLLGAALMAIAPLTIFGSHIWTFRMGHNQPGIVFMLAGLILFVRYCYNGSLLNLGLSVTMTFLAFLCYETFLGFALMYPVLYLMRSRFKGRDNPAEKPRFLNLAWVLSAMVACIALAVGSKLVLKPVYAMWGFASLSQPMDIQGVFLQNWKRSMIGDLEWDWATPGLAYLFLHFPALWVNMHAPFAPLYKTHPLYAGLLFAGFSVANVWLIRIFQQARGTLAIANYGTIVLVGALCVVAAIVTPVFSIGQLWERYIYCGYFGVVGIYAVVLSLMMTKVDKARMGGESLAILLILLALNFMEHLNVVHGFSWLWM
ncbi:MAG: hypothetical protein AB1473_14980 [Thermodesulfobacteriota bacterium]